MGVTVNFGFINEFILYFGDIGPFVAGAFFGMLLCISHYYFVRGGNDGNTCLIYILGFYPYVSGFPVGFLNDMPLPTLIISMAFLLSLGWGKWGVEVPADAVIRN